MSYLNFQLANCIREFYNIGDAWVICSKIYLLEYTEEVDPHKSSLQQIIQKICYEPVNTETSLTIGMGTRTSNKSLCQPNAI